MCSIRPSRRAFLSLKFRSRQTPIFFLPFLWLPFLIPVCPSAGRHNPLEALALMCSGFVYGPHSGWQRKLQSRLSVVEQGAGKAALSPGTRSMLVIGSPSTFLRVGLCPSVFTLRPVSMYDHGACSSVSSYRIPCISSCNT